jgi:hypothetical protein
MELPQFEATFVSFDCGLGAAPTKSKSNFAGFTSRKVDLTVCVEEKGEKKKVVISLVNHIGSRFKHRSKELYEVLDETVKTIQTFQVQKTMQGTYKLHPESFREWMDKVILPKGSALVQ